MKNIIIGLVFLSFISCKKDEAYASKTNVLYEIAGKKYYHASFINEDGNWIEADSITTGWRWQKEFTDKVKPAIIIYRIGDTTFTDISFLRLYYGFSKHESIDTSNTNKHSLNLN